MIQGCLDWLENGLVPPDAVKQATSDYFEDEDLCGRWIAECCQCGPEVKGKASDLYGSWKEYAILNGEDPGSAKAFAEMSAITTSRRSRATG